MFRPFAGVTDPHGREWEIYQSKVTLPRRRPPESTPVILSFIPRLLLRLFVDLPLAIYRALRSDTWTIEAISWAPFHTSYSWTTTREFRGQVLAHVEGSIARGDTPRPPNAQFIHAD